VQVAVKAESLPADLRLSKKKDDKPEPDEEGYLLLDHGVLETALRKMPKGRGSTKVFHSLAKKGMRGEIPECDIFKTQIDNITIEHMADYSDYFTQLAARIGMNLQVHNSHGTVQPPLSSGPDTLHIFPFSSPSTTDLMVAEELVGVPLDDLAIDVMSPSFIGKVFGDDKGRPIAEWLGSNLWILWDFQHLYSATPGRGEQILDSIFSGKLVPVENRLAADSEQIKKKLSALVKKDYDTQIRKKSDLETSSRNYETQLVNAIKELGAISLLLEGLDGKVESRVNSMMDEIASISTLNGVNFVKFDGDVLDVFTDRVIFKSGGSIRDLGCYDIRVFADHVEFKSLTRPSGAVHPHVSGTRPCWGNMGTSISKLLGSREYLALISFILEFLHSYNAGDAHNNLESCSLVLEAMPEKVDGKEVIFDIDPTKSIFREDSILSVSAEEPVEEEDDGKEAEKGGGEEGDVGEEHEEGPIDPEPT